MAFFGPSLLACQTSIWQSSRLKHVNLEGLIDIPDLPEDDSFLLAGLEMRPLVSEG